MKSVHRKSVARPNHIKRQVPRTRTAAASEMVRLEFERDCLLRDVSVMEERLATSNRKLWFVDGRLADLQRMMKIEKPSKKRTAKTGPNPGGNR